MIRNDGRQLLVETFPLTMPEPAILALSIKKNNGKLYLTGILQAYDTLNGNDRYYPLQVLKKQVLLYMKKIANNQSVGLCDHPLSDIISLKNVALIVKELHWLGKTLIGTIMLTSNSIGRDMQALVLDGVTLSISSRGLGSLKRTKFGDLVQPDFELVGWDLVVLPSTPGASFVNLSKTELPTIDDKVKLLIETKKVIKPKMTKELKLDYLYELVLSTLIKD